jgi:hypothetical protein
MMRTRLLSYIVSLSILFSSLHYVATVFGLYVDIPYFDKAMHVLGGIICALVVLFVLSSIRPFSFLVLTRQRAYVATVLCAFVVGSFWELFEYTHDITFAVHYTVDTAGDLLMDSVGAVIATHYTALRGFFRDRVSYT